MTVGMPDKIPPTNPLGSAQASRIFLLPNLMTAGNLFCGFVAIIRCIQAKYVATESLQSIHLYNEAVWFIIAAVGFDSLDGRLARLGGRESLFGKEFDSVADVVSFGVAPALLVFFLILSPDLYEPFREIGWFIGFIYLLCACVRLARFNVITHPLVYTNQAKYDTKDFVGLPVPAAAGVIVSLVLVINSVEDARKWVLLLPPLMLAIAFVMVSTIRFPSFKQLNWQTRARFGTFVLVLIAVAFVFFYRQFALFTIFLGYFLFGVIRHLFVLRRRHRRLVKLRKARAAGDSEYYVNKHADSSQ
jgi:CDP-diacylglycerol--serine O-phosphatidyltransferase